MHTVAGGIDAGGGYLMARQTYVGSDSKDPIERLDWTENWADTLVPIDDAIVALTCKVTFPGTQDDASHEITIESSQFTELDTTMMLEGGMPGKTYAASFIIDTARRRRFKRSLRIRVFLK